jgi:hypothetical protein
MSKTFEIFDDQFLTVEDAIRYADYLVSHNNPRYMKKDKTPSPRKKQNISNITRDNTNKIRMSSSLRIDDAEVSVDSEGKIRITYLLNPQITPPQHKVRKVMKNNSRMVIRFKEGIPISIYNSP